MLRRLVHSAAAATLAGRAPRREPRGDPDEVPRIQVLTAVLELLAPTRCLACRRRGVPHDAVWCTRCSGTVVFAPRPACRRCGGPRQVGHGCWPPGAPITTTRVATDYRGPVAAAVVAAKVGGATAAWPGLARYLAEHVDRDPPAVDVVTWVATAPGRARRRGTDHAAVLAHAVGEAIGVPAVALLRWERGRRGDEVQRATGPLPGSAVLLVDDVLTTGATAAGAAAALLDAGAGEVHLAVLARAGDHPLVPAAVRTGPR